MKARILFIFILAALANCRKPDRPEALIFRDGFAVGNDTTAPLVVSVTGEAGTDQLIVEFNEPVYTNAGGSGNLVIGDFSYQDNNATGATSVTGMFEANGADRIVVLTTNANLIAGDNGDRVVFPANSIFDAAGNALAATDRLIVLTIVPPTLVGAETMDTNRNGRIDHLKLTFNKNLTDATFPNYVNTGTLGGVTTAWLVAGFTNVRIDPTIAADVDNDNIIYLTWDEAVTANTALTPDLTTTASPALQATNGAVVNQIQSATVTETDAAPPVLIDATEKAGERDLVLAFSEPVYANNNATGSLTLGDFTYTNSNPGGATAFSAITDADGSNSNITIQMDTLYVLGDGNTDRIAVNNNEVYDAVGLVAVNCQTGTGCNGTYVTTRITNGDAPTLQTAETMDIDGNGKIDHYKLTFDVPVNDSTFPGYVSANGLGTVTTAWVIGTRTNLRIDTRDALPPTGPGDTVANDNVIYLAFDENAAACSGNDISGCDTGATPNLSTTASPGLNDFDPTVIAQIVSFTATDKAPPKLITLKGHGNATSLIAYFSEAVFTNTGGSGNLTAADFTYQNDNAGGATAIAGLSEANGADGKVTLTTTGSFALADDNTDDLVAVMNAIYDAGDNALVATAAVRVVPLLLSAETMDINSDGTIDHYKLTFSMAVDDSTFPGYAGNNTLGAATTEWLVANQGNVRLDTRDAVPPNGPGDTGDNDSVIFIAFDGFNHTGQMPDITTTLTPGLTPLGATPLIAPIGSIDISEQDKSDPVIISAVAPMGGLNLTVVFSERVYTNAGSGDTMQLNDFIYANVSGNGANSVIGLSEADGTDHKIVLTLNSVFTSTDGNADTISTNSGEVFDLAGNASTSVSKVLSTARYIVDNTVNAIATDGATIYLGGDFREIGPYTGGGVFVGATSSVQQNITPDFVKGTVHASAPDGNGGYFIGGFFSQVGGQPRSNIARINADGTLHAWNPGCGLVKAMALSGANLYVGGSFTTCAGQTRNSLAAIDITTGIATAWNPNANGAVETLEISGSTIYAGGSFTMVAGQTRNRLASIDAGTGVAGSWDPNISGVVETIVVRGPIIYAGGSFSTVGGQVRNRIAAIDLISGSPTSWNPNASSTVHAIAVSGSTIFAGGNFTTIGGQTRSRLAAIDATTGLANSWNPNAIGSVFRILLAGNTVFTGGNFSTIGGQTRKNLAALDSATGLVMAWDPKVGKGSVYTLGMSGTTIYVGGDFESVGVQVRDRLAAIQYATGVATAWNPSANNTVEAITLSGANVFVGGNFTNVGGATRNFLAAIDNTTGSATSWNANADGRAQNFAIYGTNLYVSGTFANIGGQARSRLAALDIATGTATSWAPSPDGAVSSLAISGSTIYVGGIFTTIDGQARNRLAAIDATSGTVTAWHPDVNASVSAIAISGSDIYVGGSFTTIGGQTRNRIGAIDATTGSVTAWNPNVAGGTNIFALSLSGSTLYVGGNITNIGGQNRNGAAALSLVNGLATAWNPNIGSSVYAISVVGSSIYFGGDFTTIGTTGFSYFAGIDATTGSVLEY
ncbi:beta strand repeat-containing protein [Turneriella parva]|uniref:Uncharacterized protein n=1 Tax=Turneriella parva (strain ATCC BAA-1111 / DSM 21527 / NCTC 11395 / H) TaxID=869212 RepID=I4B1I3_TURPD|nr:hypothetical protein [Turneriella parva]AFM11140.1 hypothetical protein Turpa_0484 [Turneriella parva DSM 21527]